jgi:hypothetical protein
MLIDKVKVPFIITRSDEGQKVYKFFKDYVVTVEQVVKASDKNEAWEKAMLHGGLKYADMTRFITNEKLEVVETTNVSADYVSTDIDYLGTIIDDDGDMVCDANTNEDNTKIVDSAPVKSNVVAINRKEKND